MDKLKSVWNKITAFAFRRKKRFYIILIVISSILLLFDLSLRVVLPNTSMLTGMLQSGVSFGDDTSLPDSADSSGDSQTDAGTGSMTMPDLDSSDSEMSLPDSSDSDFTADDMASGDASMSGGFSGGTGSSDMSGGMQDFADAEMDGSGFADGNAASGDASVPGMSGADSDLSGFSGGSDEESTQENTEDNTSEYTEEDTEESTSGGISLPLPLRILMGIRAAFWPILILALLIDGLSITMLVLISRREKKAAEEAERERIAEAIASDGEVHLVRPEQKKKVSSGVWIGVIIVIVLLVLLVKVLSSFSAEETSETEATVYEAQVESGDISTVLPGTGTLTEEDAEEISIPSEVEITTWYVSNGDSVETGDILAQIDTDSALSAIASVQEVISSLDEALAELEDADTTGTVTAAAGGRVKAVYAEEDTSVVDTIYESGSLILLSLDGLMAVAFETEADVSVGDTVTVTLSDGTEEEGSVESALEGVVVVTLTDEGTDVGDSVTVTAEDGTELGSGELYIHSQLNVLAFSGTVDSVSVSEEDEVDAGDTLLTLVDVDNSFETALLVEQRSTLEEQIQTLFKLYQEGYLYAETAGVVSGISDTDSSSSDSGEDSSEDSDSSSEVSTSGSTSSASGITAVSMSCIISVSSTEDDDALTLDLTDSNTDSDSSDDTDENESTESSYVNYSGVVTEFADSTVTVTTYQLSGSTAELETLTMTADLSETAVYVYADGGLTSGSISDVALGDTLILLCSADTDISETFAPICVIAFSSDTTSSDSDEESDDSDSNSDEESDNSDSDSGGQSGDSQDADNSGTQQNGSDTQTQSDSSGQSLEDLLSSYSTDSSASTDADTSAITDALTAASTEAAAEVAETLTTAVTTSYSVSETTVVSITPQEYVYVTITIDELDILSAEVGQEAEVTLDAFPGQSFSGIVESIDTSGTNEGGNSKYTAVIRIDREEDMLAGMNASVKITLDTAEDVLYVPAEALFEEDGVTYVYTSYDEKKDEFGDPVEVETGVSDGTNVEILSGLSEGDTYYYSVLDVVNYSTSTVSSSSSLF